MDWTEGFDPEVGLWWQGGGHTAPVAGKGRVHPAPNAATRLAWAAEAGDLDRFPALPVLEAIRRMQVTDGSPMHGCLRWYWEEPRPVDTNAAFFTGLGLIVTRRLHGDRLAPPARAALDVILGDLAVWFDRAISEGRVFYPNKHLGDLACGWLLAEILGREAALPRLAGAIDEAAGYWLAHGWGWGEHLSDTYAGVCLGELSVLLELSQRLPAGPRAACERLRDDLLAIEDAFDGPRVPALRSYAFTRPPEHANYRDTVRPLPPGEAPRFGNVPPLGPILARLGWHDHVPARAPQGTDVTVPCFGGAEARARIDGDVRLGSVSRFPLMPSADHATWGLSWQSFPVALWHRAGAWGFLQWATREDGRERAHPAAEKSGAYLHNALTGEVAPPITGRTWAVQRGGTVLALRIMPAVARSWESAADRFRIFGEARAGKVTSEGRWSELALDFAGRRVGLGYVDPGGGGAPKLVEGDGRLDWEARCDEASLKGRRAVVGLWAIRLDGPAGSPPEVRPADVTPVPRDPEETAWDVRFDWPGGAWRVVVDPLAAEALRVVEAPA